MSAKNVVILGSTGSIGINTLKVISRFPEQFRVVGLTAYNNLELLKDQVRKFKPKYLAVRHDGINYFRNNRLFEQLNVLDVDEGLDELVSSSSVDIVVIGMRGSSAIKPFLAAVKAGKTVAPANKEALVVAGRMIMQEAKKAKAMIIPVDSEQSAIFQCLEGRNHAELDKVYLTASGGRLYNVSASKLDTLSVAEILKHPRWKMGKKITVDSATLMNKGFEVIEAVRLFGLNPDQIEVLIHPEAIIHSMVGFKDGSIIAQLGVTDMRLPIQYALTYPKRLSTGLKELDFFKLAKLTFKKPDVKKFPALDLAFYAIKKDGTLPCVLNAADEVAVEAFLERRLAFSKIVKVVEKVLTKHRCIANPSLNDILETDAWAREETEKLIR